MAEITDTGKVWMRGSATTSFAIKVDNKVFVPGEKTHQNIDFWINGEYLCVDIHDKESSKRLGRRFSLNMEAKHPATLFNGFDKTKHADVKVIHFEDAGVEEFSISGKSYIDKKAGELGRNDFWKLGGFKD